MQGVIEHMVDSSREQEGVKPEAGRHLVDQELAQYLAVVQKVVKTEGSWRGGGTLNQPLTSANPATASSGSWPRRTTGPNQRPQTV